MSEVAAGRTAGTAQGLVEFLDFTAEKGLLKRATAMSQKTATKEVLSAVEGERWPSVDIHGVDADDVIRRFEGLRATKFSPESLRTYGHRFRTARSMYLDFLAKPGGWRPSLRQRDRGGASPAPSRSRASAKHSSTDESQVSSAEVLNSGAVQQGGPSMITYPFPLRDGALATLQLPRDLSRRDAKRLMAFIESVALDDQPALPPGRDQS